MSYIKGSAEAVSCPSGVLGLEQYLALGANRASNYSRETRKDVHALLTVSTQQQAAVRVDYLSLQYGIWRCSGGLGHLKCGCLEGCYWLSCTGLALKI
jgi:hypothetical protein